MEGHQEVGGSKRPAEPMLVPPALSSVQSWSSSQHATRTSFARHWKLAAEHSSPQEPGGERVWSMGVVAGVGEYWASAYGGGEDAVREHRIDAVGDE